MRGFRFLPEPADCKMAPWPTPRFPSSRKDHAVVAPKSRARPHGVPRRRPLRPRPGGALLKSQRRSAAGRCSCSGLGLLLLGYSRDPPPAGRRACVATGAPVRWPAVARGDARCSWSAPPDRPAASSVTRFPRGRTPRPERMACHWQAARSSPRAHFCRAPRPSSAEGIEPCAPWAWTASPSAICEHRRRSVGLAFLIACRRPSKVASGRRSPAPTRLLARHPQSPLYKRDAISLPPETHTDVNRYPFNGSALDSDAYLLRYPHLPSHRDRGRLGTRGPPLSRGMRVITNEA